MTKQLPDIPDEVIKGAIMLSRWVEATLGNMHNIRIYNVGHRTFLSVDDMLRERGPSERIVELRGAVEPSAKPYGWAAWEWPDGQVRFVSGEACPGEKWIPLYRATAKTAERTRCQCGKHTYAGSFISIEASDKSMHYPDRPCSSAEPTSSHRAYCHKAMGISSLCTCGTERANNL